MGTVEGLLYGFGVALTPVNLFACFIGTVLGTIVGVLPGLGPAGAMALVLPLTIKLGPTAGLIMLAGIYYGAMYGGSTTSILVNVPGEAASVVTAIDGYQMARKGRAGAALAVSAMGSFVAGSGGVVGIVLFSSWLADLALQFGPPEYFALTVMGLAILSRLSGGSVLMAFLMVGLGLAIGTVGMEPISGVRRFTFGSVQLSQGIELVPVIMGLYGVAEVRQQRRHRGSHVPAPLARYSVRSGHRHPARRPRHPRDPAGAAADRKPAGGVLGRGGEHVRRQRAAAHPEPAARRTLRLDPENPPAHPLDVRAPAPPGRRVQPQQQHARRVGAGGDGVAGLRLPQDADRSRAAHRRRGARADHGEDAAPDPLHGPRGLAPAHVSSAEPRPPPHRRPRARRAPAARWPAP